jgi:hypothetical protein
LKKNRSGGFVLLDFKAYSKGSKIKGGTIDESFHTQISEIE